MQLLPNNRVFIHYNGNRWNWTSPPRPYFNLWIATTGFGEMESENNRFEIRPGFALIIHPDQEVKAKIKGTQNITNVALHFLLDESDELYRALNALRNTPIHVRHLSLIVSLAEHLESLISLSSSTQSYTRTNVIAREVLLMILDDATTGPEDPHDAAIREQVQSIKSQLHKDWALPALAEMVHLSTSHYTRRFTRLIGTSPKNFIIETKLDRAKTLLRESTLNIAEIAQSLGYRDSAFFCRQFKTKTGLPPLQFRQNTPS